MGTYFYQKYRHSCYLEIITACRYRYPYAGAEYFASDLYESVVTDKYHTPYKMNTKTDHSTYALSKMIFKNHHFVHRVTGRKN